MLFTNVGVEASERSRLSINHSSIEYAASVGVKADSPTADSIATIRDSELCFNGSGVQAGPGAAKVYVGSSRLAFNTTAFGLAGGSNFSYGQVPTVTVGGVAAQVLTSTAGIVTARLGAGTTHGPIELTNEVGKVTMSGPFTANSGPTHPGFFVVTGPSGGRTRAEW